MKKSEIVLLLIAVTFAILFTWRAFTPTIKTLERKVYVAQQGQAVAEGVTKIIERNNFKERVVTEKAEANVQIIHAAPGADDPVPPAVLAAWRAGVRFEGPASTEAGPATDPAK